MCDPQPASNSNGVRNEVVDSRSPNDVLKSLGIPTTIVFDGLDQNHTTMDYVRIFDYNIGNLSFDGL